jgi:hypothetical protein
MEIKKDNVEKPIIPSEVKSNDITHSVYNIMIRVVVLFVVYILLFTVLYYTELQVYTPVIVLISFFISKPLTKFFISNVLPKLIK